MLVATACKDMRGLKKGHTLDDEKNAMGTYPHLALIVENRT